MKKIICVYINGRMLPEVKACVSVFDRGLNYGDGLFETMKARNGYVYFMREHLGRLKEGAKAIGIPKKSIKPLEAGIKNGAMERLLEMNGLLKGDAYLRITLTRGVDKGGHAPPGNIEPTVIITAKPLDALHIASHQRDGVRAVFIRGCRPAIPWIKTLNYLPNVMGKAEAEKRGAFEGIFTGKDSSIKEGTSTSVFIVTKGAIKTPPLEEGVLPGITRKTVIRLAQNKGIPIREAPLYVKDLLGSGEAFLTNSVLEVTPLIRVEDFAIGGGSPGPITRLIQRYYAALVTKRGI